MSLRSSGAPRPVHSALTTVLVVASALLPATISRAQAPASRPPVPGAPAGVTAFVGVSVVPMDTNRVLPGYTVLVEGGRVTALGPSTKVKVPAGATQIDGQGKFLIPGLADMHAHLRSLVAAPADLERWLFLYVANGVTTIRNMDASGDVKGELLQFKARAAAGTLWSPRIYTSRSIYGPSFSAYPAPAEIAKYVAAYQAAGYDHIKYYNGEQGELFDSLVAAARRLGMPIAGHAENQSQQEEVFDGLDKALRAGFASIEHLTGYHHGVLGTPNLSKVPALVAATKRAGVWNCPTLWRIWETQWGMRNDTAAAWPELQYWYSPSAIANFKSLEPFPEDIPKVDAARRLVKALQDSGAGLLLGVDVEAARGVLADPAVAGFSVHRELQAFVRAGLTSYQALLTGTRNVAAYFKTLDETGTVAVGKRADLVLLDGNPLDDIRHTERPAGVMIGGRWLARPELDRRLAEIKAAVAVSP
jgi:imidazolonepropionase-like amidohydrolase